VGRLRVGSARSVDFDGERAVFDDARVALTARSGQAGDCLLERHPHDFYSTTLKISRYPLSQRGANLFDLPNFNRNTLQTTIIEASSIEPR
jgi:hypothetical protein